MIDKKFTSTQLVPKELDYLKSKGTTKEEILAQFKYHHLFLALLKELLMLIVMQQLFFS